MITNENFLARIEGRCGIIEMARSSALNSLTVEMIRDFHDALNQFESDDGIRVVIIGSTTERAFCAGGDVRWVREHDLAGDYAAGDEFFREEYRLNARMANYSKPIVALLNGVVMGGGFGVSAHGSHRLVTKTTLGAMPEAAIGFVPDVGMTHVLTHLPVGPEIGMFVGLTGWRLSPADMLWTGLGTHIVEDTTEVVEALRSQQLMPVFERLAIPAEEAGDSVLAEHADVIRAAFAHDEWVDIERELRAIADGASVADTSYNAPDRAGVVGQSDAPGQASGHTAGQAPVSEEFRAALKEQLDSANPESLVAGFELFRRSAESDLDTALANEFEVGGALRRRPNFAEGVRAVLVDKDRNASFDPASSDQIDAAAWRSMLR